jgi:hypothetical protein
MAPGAERLLFLQQAAGNRATRSVLAPVAGTAHAADAGSRLGVQRAAEGTEDRAPGALIVDDGAALGAGQMTKTQFLAEMRGRITATAERGFTGSGWTAQDCPALARWFDYYAAKDAGHIERAVRAYTTTPQTSAEAYIAAASRRVALSVAVFATTGRVVGLPEGISAREVDDGGDPAALDVGAGTGGGPPVQRVGDGEALPPEGERLATAMGVNPAAVRVHHDDLSARRADRLDAHAFTEGNRISFGSGAYRPGTPVGDGLLAHELAHVAQQSGTRSPGQVGGEAQFEADADRSAFAAVSRLWSGAARSLAGVVSTAVPRLRGGIRLQRCRRSSAPPSFLASDYLVEGAEPSADPHTITFARGADTLDAGNQAKVKAVAAAEKTNPLAVYGSASEDEPSPTALADRRMHAVDAKLGAEGHLGAPAAPRTLANKAADAVGTISYRSVRRVEIQVGSAAVPVPPSEQEDCSTTVAKPCTAANTAALNAAATSGTTMLSTAITKLGAPDAATKALVRRLFMAGNAAATDAQVVAKAGQVKVNLTDWRAHLGTVMGAANHRCVKTCDPGCEGADAYNQGLGATALKSFCASHFAKGADEQKNTLVHECGHGTPSVDSVDIAYGDMRQLDTLTDAEALKNTDSYTVLVRNLAVPGSAPIGGSDVFAGGMTAAEESMARRALSWTEVWLNACDQQVSEAYSAATTAATAPGGWTASFGSRIMNIIALEFPGINRPTAGSRPTLEDRTRVAAIFDRYSKMITALFGQQIRVEKIAAGVPGWDAGPGSTVRVDASFFGFTDRQRLERMLSMIAAATPGVSSTILPHYVRLADLLRQVRSLGTP